MYYSRAKLASVLAICFLGLLLCLPNVLRKPLPFIPWRQIHLGLDLRGGSYLLLQIDLQSLTHDRLQTLSDVVRDTLLDKKLGYRNITIDVAQARLTFQPRTPSELHADIEALQALPQSTTPHEFQVTQQGNDIIALTLSPESLRQRAYEAVTRSIEIVRRRIDGTGVIDPQITRQGNDRIVVELPGMSDPTRIKALLGTTARMTFRLVDPNMLHATYPPPGVSLLPLADDPNGARLPVFDHIDVDGSDLTNAGAVIDQRTGEWAVNFSFDSVGTRAFATVTKANVGHRFAIVLDNKVIEAPVIRTPITAGDGQITGNFDVQKASDLALLLRAGALPAPLKVIEQRTIGPSLGADSIRAGIISLAIGFLMVVLFMALFYGRFGWYANASLLANLVLMVAILSLFEATLSLPGMAGMLLTLGMAVDANILINERIREEVNRGRTALSSMQSGFEKATSTIVDSNATALLAHVMLFVFGTGPVRGFALTITVGIVTSLFTTLLLSRMLMARWYTLTRPTSLPV
ncbi:MAG: protein translocase subunit SecD [Acetobacter sp.]|nr:protein translocase subunit SecD [Acetobacter sp.]